MSMDRVVQIARERFQFRLVNGAGGSQQLRRKLGDHRWLVVTAEDDTLAIPPDEDAWANLAVFDEDPDENPDPIFEKAYPSLTAALNAAMLYRDAHFLLEKYVKWHLGPLRDARANPDEWNDYVHLISFGKGAGDDGMRDLRALRRALPERAIQQGKADSGHHPHDGGSKREAFAEEIRWALVAYIAELFGG